MLERQDDVCRASPLSSLSAVAPRPPAGTAGSQPEVTRAADAVVGTASASAPMAAGPPWELGGFPWECYEQYCPHPEICVLSGCAASD